MHHPYNSSQQYVGNTPTFKGERLRALRDVIMDDNANLPRHITQAKLFHCVVLLFSITQTTSTARVLNQLYVSVPSLTNFN